MSIELRDIDITLDTPIDGGVAVENVQIQNSVNSVPQVHIRGHLRKYANRATAEVELAEQSQVLADLQQGFFNPRLRPESRLTVKVGQNQQLDMPLYLTSVGLSQGHGRVGVQLSFAHTAAALKSLDLSIYEPYHFYGKNVSTIEDMDASDFFQMLGDIEGSLGMRMSSILRRLTTDPTFFGDIDAAARAVREQIHGSNLPFLGYIHNFLQTSDGLDGWAVDGLSDSFSEGLNKFLLSNQINNPTNFFNLLTHYLNQEFLMLLVTGLNDVMPRWVSLSQIAASNPVSIDLPIGMVNIQAGARGLIPTTNTLLVQIGNEQYPEDDGAGRRHVALMLHPDETVPGGLFQRIHGPAWLFMLNYSQDKDQGISHETRHDELQHDLERLRTRSVSWSEQIRRVTGSSGIKNRLKRYVKLQHLQSAYGILQAGTTTDIDFRLQPGVCYKVNSLEEGPLFLGFLQSVNHTITVQKRGGQAGSNLTFTHVRTGDGAGMEDTGTGLLNEEVGEYGELPSSGLTL